MPIFSDNQLVDYVRLRGGIVSDLAQEIIKLRRALADIQEIADCEGVSDRDAMLAFCQGRCVRCGVEGFNLVQDHITPIYQEGSDGIDNLQPLCAKCTAARIFAGKDQLEAV